MHIETDRTYIREFCDGDAEESFLFYGDQEVMRYIGKGNAHISEGEKQELMLKRQDYYQNHPGFGVWAVVEKSTNELIGHTALIFTDSKEVEVAYLLKKEKWGLGFATEITKATIKYGRQSLGLGKIVAFTYSENVASIKVLKKCGMNQIGLADYLGVQMVYFVHKSFSY